MESSQYTELRSSRNSRGDINEEEIVTQHIGTKDIKDTKQRHVAIVLPGKVKKPFITGGIKWKICDGLKISCSMLPNTYMTILPNQTYQFNLRDHCPNGTFQLKYSKYFENICKSIYPLNQEMVIVKKHRTSPLITFVGKNKSIICNNDVPYFFKMKLIYDYDSSSDESLEIYDYDDYSEVQRRSQKIEKESMLPILFDEEGAQLQ